MAVGNMAAPQEGIVETTTSKTESHSEERPPTGYHDLPTRVIVRVLSHLSPREVAAACLVCRSWRRAARDPSLWRELCFRGTRIDAVCRKLRASPELRSVKFHQVHDVATAIRQICRCNRQLRHLAVRRCERLPEAVLLNLLQCCPQLETIDLRNTDFVSHKVLRELWRLPRLRRLDVGGCRSLRTPDLLLVALNCRGLVELRLARCPQLTDGDAAVLVGALSRSLTQLALDVHNLSEATFQAIGECGGLESLSLTGALGLSGDLLCFLASRLPRLRALRLHGAAQLRCADVERACGAGLRALRHLDLSGCWRLGDRGLLAAAAACTDALQVLRLRACKAVTGDGLRRAAALCPALALLDVAHDANVDGAALVDVATALPQLRELVVESSPSKERALSPLVAGGGSSLRVVLSLSEFSKKMKPLEPAQ